MPFLDRFRKHFRQERPSVRDDVEKQPHLAPRDSARVAAPTTTAQPKPQNSAPARAAPEPQPRRLSKAERKAMLTERIAEDAKRPAFVPAPQRVLEFRRSAEDRYLKQVFDYLKAKHLNTDFGYDDIPEPDPRILAIARRTMTYANEQFLRTVASGGVKSHIMVVMKNLGLRESVALMTFRLTDGAREATMEICEFGCGSPRIGLYEGEDHDL